MKKRSLIIYGYGANDGHSFRQGVINDAHHFAAFQQSSNGGGWIPKKELVSLRNPSKNKIRELLTGHQNADISTVYFSGHGYRKNGQDYICINGTEDLPASSLFVNAKRQVVIIDSCRNEVSHFDGGLGGIGSFSFDFSHLEKARKVYNHLIASSPFGKTLLFSGSPGESSVSNPDGGVFSKAMFLGLQNFSDSKSGSLLTVKDVFHFTKKGTLRSQSTEYGPQTPTMYRVGPQGGAAIPLAINHHYYLRKIGHSQTSPEYASTGSGQQQASRNSAAKWALGGAALLLLGLVIKNS